MEPLLSEHKNTHRFGGGRPRVPDRVCADGIFFVLRTGCQWNALSATGLCPSSTAHDRFQAWVLDGFFLRFWRAGLAEYDAFKGTDWTWLTGTRWRQSCQILSATILRAAANASANLGHVRTWKKTLLRRTLNKAAVSSRRPLIV